MDLRYLIFTNEASFRPRFGTELTPLIPLSYEERGNDPDRGEFMMGLRVGINSFHGLRPAAVEKPEESVQPPTEITELLVGKLDADDS